jgi:large subunit ribosomal protein L30
MTDKSVKVTLIRSLAGQLANIRASARGLGLRRIGHSVVVSDTPSNRGMMNTASHMLDIEPASAGAPPKKRAAPKKTAPKKTA